jgi:hypothetical protein
MSEDDAEAAELAPSVGRAGDTPTHPDSRHIGRIVMLPV